MQNNPGTDSVNTNENDLYLCLRYVSLHPAMSQWSYRVANLRSSIERSGMLSLSTDTKNILDLYKLESFISGFQNQVESQINHEEMAGAL